MYWLLLQNLLILWTICDWKEQVKEICEAGFTEQFRFARGNFEIRGYKQIVSIVVC